MEINEKDIAKLVQSVIAEMNGQKPAAAKARSSAVCSPVSS